MRITGSPDALFAPTTPGAFGGLGLTAGDLPGDWASYTADQKISYFNENGISADELAAAGVPQSDLDWMAQHGYTGTPANTSPAEDVQRTAQAVQTAPVEAPATVGNVTLPPDWATYDPYQKIAFFNANNVTASQLLAAGVAQVDIDWMLTQGYTGQAAPTTVQTVTQSTTPATTMQTKTEQTVMTLPAGYDEHGELQVFTLPADFDKYTAEQKIRYFNQNSIQPQTLIEAGASADDIAWMKQHGYTGKPGLTITKTSTDAVTPAGGAVPLVLAVAAAYFLGA